jgi:hypothetical protein
MNFGQHGLWTGRVLIACVVLLASCGIEADSSATLPAVASAVTERQAPIEASAQSNTDVSTSTSSSRPAVVIAARPAAVDVKPELIEIIPASGQAGAAYPMQATIRGQGFAATGNTIVFGPIALPNLPSGDGSRITFTVPKVMPSRGEASPLVLNAGDYLVTATTSGGTSNAITFTMTRGP